MDPRDVVLLLSSVGGENPVTLEWIIETCGTRDSPYEGKEGGG